MAGLHQGYIVEIPLVRVDCFTNPRTPITLPRDGKLIPAPTAQIYLLSHVHTDHLTGLSDNFCGKIVCSEGTKALLLQLEEEKERAFLDRGQREVRSCKYENLRPRRLANGTMYDPIETRPYGQPKEYDLGYYEGKAVRVTITLFDANHCPGSTMFLITTPDVAVLHTGDVRADSAMLSTLNRSSVLHPYLSGMRRLDRIYIDTSALGGDDMPEKTPVIETLVNQMSFYPPSTIFFLNIWTLGWESILKGIFKTFNVPVHVDRYKRTLYEASGDTELLACTTTDPSASRFHACERYHPCSGCKDALVRVTMVEGKEATWDVEQARFIRKLESAAMGEAKWPTEILVPLARHSSLPELSYLVALFNPRSLSPNTLVPTSNGIDFYLMADSFSPVLEPEAVAAMKVERDVWFASNPKYGPHWLANVQRLLGQLPPLRHVKPHLTPGGQPALVQQDELQPGGQKRKRSATIEPIASEGSPAAAARTVASASTARATKISVTPSPAKPTSVTPPSVVTRTTLAATSTCVTRPTLSTHPMPPTQPTLPALPTQPTQPTHPTRTPISLHTPSRSTNTESPDDNTANSGTIPASSSPTPGSRFKNRPSQSGKYRLNVTHFQSLVSTQASTCSQE